MTLFSKLGHNNNFRSFFYTFKSSIGMNFNTWYEISIFHKPPRGYGDKLKKFIQFILLNSFERKASSNTDNFFMWILLAFKELLESINSRKSTFVLKKTLNACSKAGTL